MKDSLLVKTFDFHGDAIDVMAVFKDRKKLFCLDSSLHRARKGRYSFIGFDPSGWIEGKNRNGLNILRNTFNTFKIKTASPLTPFPAGLAGSLSYDYGLTRERIKLQARDDLKLPLYGFGFYDCVLTIDHSLKKLIVTGLVSSRRKFGRVIETLNSFQSGQWSVNSDQKKVKSDQRFKFAKLKSNFTKREYIKTVKKALRYIAQGDIYQVNLSQRFTFDCGPKSIDQIELYRILREFSPSDFGCYFDAGDFQIISSSPERFLNLQGRTVVTSPMKGTRRRGKNAREDARLKKQILDSLKDKAELLMVTDLERNDLGRVCEFGSVRVKEMREVEKYRFVFQTTSTVEGTLRRDKDAFDLIQACFPSGSITGCPKIRAMEIIEELEPTRRAFYTGSLGYISVTGGMDFNVLIRTLLISRNKVCFQVGGGIVADSKPEDEFNETLIKAEAMKLSLEKLFQRHCHSEERRDEESQIRRPQIIYINDKFIEADQQLVESLAPGVLKAKGVFETIRVYQKIPFAFEKHFLRMIQGLHVLKIPFKISSDRLSKIIHQLLEKNRLSDGRLRIQIWKEKGKVRVAVLVWPLRKHQPFYKAKISRVKQNKNYRSHVKTLYYGHFRQALQEARDEGYDEAILLNHQKQIVEGAHTNIFMVKDNVILTPAISCGCLNGVTRDLVLSCARQLSIQVREGRITLPQFLKADEIFMTNSLIEIKPLIQVQHNKPTQFKVGPVTQKISTQFHQFVSRYLKLKKSLL